MNQGASNHGLRVRTGALIVLGILVAIALGPWTYGILLLAVWCLGGRELMSTVHLARGRFRPSWLWMALALMIWSASMVGLARMGGWFSSYQPWLPLGWFVLIWLNDTGAYFVGRTWGKHPLSPRWSPGKTWEGWLGGAMSCLATSLVLKVTFPVEGPWEVWALVVVFLGPAGDLAASGLKRRAGIKDFGRFFPGHGGILDRFDSQLFAAPMGAAILPWL